MKGLGTIRNGGIAGIMFVVVVVGVGFLAPPPPAADDSAGKFLEYLRDNRTGLMIQASISCLAGIPLVPFALAFSQRLELLEGENAMLGKASAVALLVGWAAVAPVAAMYGGLAWLANGSLGESDAKALTILVTVGYGAGVAMWAGAAIFSALALIGAEGRTRWLGWFGVVVAIVCAVGIFGWASSGTLSPGQAIFIPYIGVMIYLLANAIQMLRLERR